MARVKGGTIHRARRKKVMKLAKVNTDYIKQQKNKLCIH